MLTILAIAVFISFLIGTFLSLHHILLNRYFHYEMFRLIALSFQENLNAWVIGGVLIVCVLGILYVIGKLLGRIQYKNLVWTCGICLGLFFTVGWAINRYLLPYRYHPVSLLANAGLVLLLIFLGRKLVKVRVGEKILYRIALMKKRLARVFSTKLMRILGGSLRRTSVLVVVLLLVLNLALVIDGKLNAPKELNVVWIVIDALRADHLGCYGYERDTSPFIDTFARENILFKHAFSQESFTVPSVSSFFTSIYPPVHKVFYNLPTADILNSTFVTVAEILRNVNYQTAAFVLYNPLQKFNIMQGFDFYDDDMDGLQRGAPPSEGYETAKKILEKVERYLGKHEKRPLFLYLHYMDVHSPYAPPSPYHELFTPPNVQAEVDMLYPDGGDLTVDRNNAELIISQYDGEIKYTDSYLEKTMKLLNDYNINTENSVFVITADHGEEFWDFHPGDKGGRIHGRTLYMEQIHVPLILSIPDLEPKKKVLDSYVELMDIAPTLLDLAGVDYANYQQFQGKSLISLLKNDDADSRMVYSGGRYHRGTIISDGWKYYSYDKYTKKHRLEGHKRPPKNFKYEFGEELYNITTDPKETENLIEQEKDVTWELKEKLWMIKELYTSGEDGQSVQLDDQTLEQLKTLGYIK